MTFYLIKPKDESSHSRKWFVDEFGLEKVKAKYTAYNKHPDNIINRWPEFDADITDKIWFDFGGMLRVGTPNVKEVVCGATFELIVTHIPIFIHALKSKDHMSGDYWQCGGRWHNYVFGKKVRDKLITKFTAKEKLYNEMIEGFNKEMDDVISKNDKVISLQKYHRDYNE